MVRIKGLVDTPSLAFYCAMPSKQCNTCVDRRERYGPLDLEESTVYCCIRLAGEFIGMIERLFQALKVEIKQFNEFENWLEQGIHYHTLGCFILTDSAYSVS